MCDFCYCLDIECVCSADGDWYYFYVGFYFSMCLECEFERIVDVVDVVNDVMGIDIRGVFALNDL